MEEKSQAVVEKKPQEKFVPPAGAMGKIYCNRFGKIFSNISIVAAALCLAILLSSLMTGMLVIVAFLVMVLAIPFTLGLILVAVPNYFSIFQSTANIMDKISFKNKSLFVVCVKTYYSLQLQLDPGERYGLLK